MSIIANGLVILGACVLTLAIVPARGVIRQLSQGSIQRRWKILIVLILLFIGGYIGYAVVSWNNYYKVSDLLVPAVFFFGALFVLLVNTLSLQTSIDVKRISTLERENITDSLMGIHNRRYFDRRLNEEVSRASRYGLPLSILLLDIDHFKKVNDVFGHQVGDAVLSNLGQLIMEIVRKPDIVARYGGEEIVVITANTSSSNAMILAERLRKKVETSVMAPSDEKKEQPAVRVTVSIGVAALSRKNIDGQALVESADKALYRAKKEGRNRIVVDNSLNNDQLSD